MNHLINITHLRTLLDPYEAQSLMDKLLRENTYTTSKMHTYKVNNKYYKSKVLRNVYLYEAITTLTNTTTSKRSWGKELMVLSTLANEYNLKSILPNTTDTWDKVIYKQISYQILKPRYPRKTKKDKEAFLKKWNRHTYSLWQAAAIKIGKDELL